VGQRLARPAAPADVRALADWAELFDAEFDYLYRTVRSFGLKAADAEDVAQEVFLAMWQRRETYDSRRPLRPWIAGIAFRALLTHRRRGRRELPMGLVEVADDVPCPDEHLESAQARHLVIASLGRVPEKQRAILMMHELDGLSAKEIADELALPLFTVYSRLHRGLRAFAREVRRAQNTEALAPAFRTLSPAALLRQEVGAMKAPAPARQRSSRRLALLLAAGPGVGREAPAPASPGLTGRLFAPMVAASGLLLVGTLAVMISAASPPLTGDVTTPAAVPATPNAGPPARAPVALAERAEAPPPAEDAEAAAAALGRGMVGYWRFDEALGSTVAPDLSGQANNCMLRKLNREKVWSDGAVGGALALTGKGWLECPATGALAGIQDQLTIAAWITRGQKTRNYRALVSRQLETGRLDELFFGFANGDLVFVSHAWNGRVSRPLPADASGWIHVAVTRTPDGTITLFANGAELAHAPSARVTLPRGGNPIIIGASVNDRDPRRTETRFDGAIDELLVYDRALGASEIAALAARQQPRPPPAP
jgi:RNA polymerase sigma-70 factor, ECF subfamily